MFDEPIRSFREEYEFLSNPYKCRVLFNGIWYPSSEHAYQASKTVITSIRKNMAKIRGWRDVKRRGNKVQLRRHWEEKKDHFMYRIVKAKFKQNKDLLIKLIATGEAHLEEGNDWGDTYWGTVNGQGQNCLGTILMRVREELQ